MDIEELYKNDIEALWNEQTELISKRKRTPDDEIICRGYAVEKELPHDDVLFLGMNPAYDEEKEADKKNFFYPVCCGNSYFTAVSKLSDAACRYTNPSHHDLLFVRNTRQNQVAALFDKELYKEFMQKQLDVSASIIKRLSPKLIVILNAGAVIQFEKIFKNDTRCPYDEKLGAYRFIINDSTPVLYSSMLSGVRPLDKGSRRSLEWHIRFIMEILNKQ